MKLSLQFYIQTLSTHGKYCPAQRFKGQFAVACEIPFGVNRVFGQVFPYLAYGIQKFSFQRLGVISHRRNLLEIALKAKLPIFAVLSSVFYNFFLQI